MIINYSEQINETESKYIFNATPYRVKFEGHINLGLFTQPY